MHCMNICFTLRDTKYIVCQYVMIKKVCCIIISMYETNSQKLGLTDKTRTVSINQRQHLGI